MRGDPNGRSSVLRTLTLAALVAATLAGVDVAAAGAHPSVGPKCRASGAPLVCAIHKAVKRTNAYRAAAGQARYRYWYGAERAASLPHDAAIRRREHLLERWRVRLHRAEAAYLRARASPRGYARMLLASHGWSLAHWPALDRLWGPLESSWNPAAVNPRSGACGIPQFLPCRYWGDWRGQVRAGLRYIDGRYGSPAAALAFRLAYGWY